MDDMDDPQHALASAELAFRVTFQGRRLLVEIGQERATYTLLEGDALELTHFGEGLTVDQAEPLTRRFLPRPSGSRQSSRPAVCRLAGERRAEGCSQARDHHDLVAVISRRHAHRARVPPDDRVAEALMNA